jgi:hypothetical protein
MVVGAFVGWHLPAALLWLISGEDPWSPPINDVLSFFYGHLGMCLGIAIGLLFGCAVEAKGRPDSADSGEPLDEDSEIWA